MKFKEIESKKLLRAYEFGIARDDLNKKVDQKLEIARTSFQMKGFRKGRTPLSMMKKMFGNSTRGEVIQELVDSSIRDHLEKKDHKPASRPSVDLKSGDINEENDLIFTFKYEVLPEIPEFDYKKLSLNKFKVQIDEKSVAKALDELANSACIFHPKAKKSKAEKGDQVIIDFVGSIEGQEFEGGAAQDYPLVLGSNSFIPGFEEQLVGCKESEEVAVKVKFPKDYGSKNLAGKDSIFACKIKTINAPKSAKIDDELAKKFSSKNLSELKDNIRERLASEYTTFSRSLLKKDLMDALEKNVEFELPQSLIDAEIKQIITAELENTNKKDSEDTDKELKASADQKKLAKRRVTLGLFFAEEGSRNGIQVSEKEYKDAVLREASQYPGKENDFFKFLDGNPSAKEQIRAPIFEEKVFDFMIKLINPNEKNISFDEFKKRFDKTMGDK